MIIDTSALIAILRDEPQAKECAVAIERDPIRRLSAASFVETALVIDGSLLSPAAASTILSEKRTLPLNQSPKLKRELHARPIAISVRAADIPPS